METINIDRQGRKLSVNTNGIFLGEYRERLRELVGKTFYDPGPRSLYEVQAVVEKGGQRRLRCRSLLEGPEEFRASFESCEKDREIEYT